MEENILILAEDQYYSLDCYSTRLNNNVLVVGTSGAGKTRSVVEPNLLQAAESYIISDPKGNLYGKYKDYFKRKGYRVMKLDFTDPEHSSCYNFFQYIYSVQDIVKVAHMMIYQDMQNPHMDPFWDQASQLLLQACIAYLIETAEPQGRNFKRVMELISACEIDENNPSAECVLDILMDDLEKTNRESYAARTYKKFRIAAGVATCN